MNEPEAVEFQGSAVAPQHARGPVAERDGHNPFPVVAVGASAGGVEAFRQLLGGLPADSGMAFILVLHLDPRHQSQLAQVLSRSTTMPVIEATDGLPVQPNHVYVIQPNTNLSISEGMLRTTPRVEARGPHLPVDYLFRSLAEEQQGRAVAVVLTGTGSDGTLGLCEVKAVGGITFAQDEGTANHPGMPHSAAESGCVDFVLPLQVIGERLIEIGRHPYLSSASLDDKLRQLHEESNYNHVLGVVARVKGVDFSLYRDTTIKRRILRRMALHGHSRLGDYARLLDEDRDEVEALYRDLLINVTSFFRDPPAFEALKKEVFPEIVRDKGPHVPVRVWVPGCSTGQEAYSIAIALLEFFDDQPSHPPIQIFATDLSDPPALEKARAGMYPETIEAEVSSERLRRFFHKQDHVYRVQKTLRDMCVFARQNVTSDPPFSHVDLISCRNVLIYLASPLQKRVLPTFHYALNEPGFLLLGSAETVGDNGDLFEVVDRDQRIYSKKHAPVRLPQGLPADVYKLSAALSTRRPIRGGPTSVDYQREADRVLLGRFAPPGVLVDENLDVLQYRGRTSPYLEPPSGEPTTNLLKMAREGLFLELRNAIEDAKRTRQAVRREHVRVQGDSGLLSVDLEIVPIRAVGAADPASWLVLFHPSAEAAARGATPPRSKAADKAASAPADIESDPVVAQLRQELAATRDYMQSLVEQQDAVNEELRSANEEILSSNEEMQSTNEELETAKEELQSANEELTTVNEQVQHRNLELTQTNNDLTNLLSSTNLPLIMVGPDLRLRLFTPPARKALNVLPTDVGRPLTDLRPTIDVPELESLVIGVIETVQPHEREVKDRDGRWHSLRIFPYRTADHRIQGAVLVLVDIDHIKRAEETLREADRRKDEFLAMLAHELRNPIAPIRNATEIIRLAGSDPRVLREAQEVLQRQVAQLSRIVEDLIDVSRIVERKIELRPERVALDAVVDMAVETSRSFIEACRHRLDISLPAPQVHLDVDPTRLAQVLVNLLNNAAKFMDPGGRIWLTAERVKAVSSRDGHETVRIKVRDAGPGIAPELLPRVFDLFAQGGSATDRRGGLGIGLTLVQSLVRMQGGQVEARSAGSGKGSEFVIDLPVAPAEQAPRAQPADSVAAVAMPAHGRRRILVVDDNEDQAQSLSLLLSLLGHEVEVARDGPGAIEAARRFRPEVGLIDIGLPGMSGYDVARELRRMKDLGSLVLVAQTGWGQESDRRRSDEAGFDHHVVKPLDLDRLRGILAAVSNGEPDD